VLRSVVVKRREMPTSWAAVFGCHYVAVARRSSNIYRVKRLIIADHIDYQRKTTTTTFFELFACRYRSATASQAHAQTSPELAMLARLRQPTRQDHLSILDYSRQNALEDNRALQSSAKKTTPTIILRKRSKVRACWRNEHAEDIPAIGLLPHQTNERMMYRLWQNNDATSREQELNCRSSFYYA